MDREFIQMSNVELHGGRFPIPMDVVWVHRGLTLGASSSRSRLEETPLIGHPILPAPLVRPE